MTRTFWAGGHLEQLARLPTNAGGVPKLKLQDPACRHTPCTDDDEPWLDEGLDRELTVYMRPHLIVHSDTHGYYVPIDFADILYGAPGGDMLGSSHRLFAELRQLAPYLGVALDERRNLSDGEASRLAGTSEDDPRFARSWRGCYCSSARATASS